MNRKVRGGRYYLSGWRSSHFGNAKNKRCLDERVYRTECGNSMDHDANAAVNICEEEGGS